jgi:hypothetical protein
MNLLTLHVDVLLQLMKFLNPVDQFNLVLSGTIKGFESVHEGIDLRQRYSEHFIEVRCEWFLNCYLLRIKEFGIELGSCRDGTCELEIRLVFNLKVP